MTAPESCTGMASPVFWPQAWSSDISCVSCIELGARVVRMGKAGSAARLAASLVSAVGSQQGGGHSPRGLIAPANEPARAAYLLAVLTVNLSRVELAPLDASAGASDVLTPLLAAQQVGLIGQCVACAAVLSDSMHMPVEMMPVVPCLQRMGWALWPLLCSHRRALHGSAGVLAAAAMCPHQCARSKRAGIGIILTVIELANAFWQVIISTPADIECNCIDSW